MVKIDQVVLNLHKLLRSLIVFLKHFKIIFAQLSRNPLVVWNVLIDLHDHFLAPHAIDLHVLT